VVDNLAANAGTPDQFVWSRATCDVEPIRGGQAAAWPIGGGQQGQHLACAARYTAPVDSWLAYGPFDTTAFADGIRVNMRYHLDQPRPEGGSLQLCATVGPAVNDVSCRAVTDQKSGWMSFDEPVQLLWAAGHRQAVFALRYVDPSPTGQVFGAMVDNILVEGVSGNGLQTVTATRPGTSTATATRTATPAPPAGPAVLRFSCTFCPRPLPMSGKIDFPFVVGPGMCGGPVEDVDVAVNVWHPWRWDVITQLQAPGSSWRQLFSHLDSDSDHIGNNRQDLILDDEALIAVNAGDCQNKGDDRCVGSYYTYSEEERRPRVLRQIYGSRAEGTWGIRFSDDYRTDSGTIMGWSVTIKCGAVAAVPTAVPSLTPTRPPTATSTTSRATPTPTRRAVLATVTPEPHGQQFTYLPSVWNAVALPGQPLPPTVRPGASPTMPPAPTEPPTPEPEQLATTIEDDSPDLVRRGSWRVVRDQQASGGSYIVSGGAGDALELRFRGDHADVWRVMSGAGGSATVTIDGVTFGPVSSHFFETRWRVPAVFDHLGGGPHRAVITAESAGFAFDVWHGPSLYEATAAQLEAIAQLNHHRRLAGIPEARLHRAIDLAAQAHAEYDSSHQHREGHRETEGQPGFTGVRFSDRMAYFGYVDYSWEAMVGAMENGSDAIDAWMTMMMHRIPLMQADGVDVGFGHAGTGFAGSANVLDTGTRGYDYNRRQPPYTYPADGQTNVPIEWEGFEAPDLLAGKPKPVGYPLSVHLGPEAVALYQTAHPLPQLRLESALARPLGAWDIEVATLSDAAGRSLPVHSFGPQSHEYIAQTPAFFIVAQRPLSPNTRYTARLVARDSMDYRFERQWSFTTGTGLAALRHGLGRGSRARADGRR
jgi:subtilisin-like proprotein convertase family protein